MTAIVKTCKCTVFSSGSVFQIYRVTDEALIAETAVWPNFFLMNIFLALKGSKLIIIILLHICCLFVYHLYIVHLVSDDPDIDSQQVVYIRLNFFSRKND